jgi:hypothetical protein
VTAPGPGVPGAGEPLDEYDITILDGLRDMYSTVDPVPAGLVELVQFAVDLEDLDVEVGRLTGTPALAQSVRAAEHSRLITFDSDSMTIMVNLTAIDDGGVRVDGWLAPPGSHRVELRTATDRLVATADDQGRFVLSSVPHGLAQLIVEPTGPDGAAGSVRSIVTPSLLI